MSSFALLQADLKAGRTDRMVFYAFDLLYLDGYDLTRVPLIERKTLLAGLLDDAPADAVVRLSAHMERDGAAMVRHACRLGLEGIVSKRKDKPYAGGRGTALAEDQVHPAPGVRHRRLRAVLDLEQGRGLAGAGRPRGRHASSMSAGSEPASRRRWPGACGVSSIG